MATKKQPKAPAKKVGRPRKHDRAEILSRLFAFMEAGNSIRAFAKREKIDEAELRRWCATEEFQPQYARAREAQVHVLAEDVIRIADDPDLAPDAKRVMVDARKWYAGKIAPKTYGDRIQQDVTVNLSLADELRAARERVAGR